MKNKVRIVKSSLIIEGLFREKSRKIKNMQLRASIKINQTKIGLKMKAK